VKLPLIAGSGWLIGRLKNEHDRRLVSLAASWLPSIDVVAQLDLSWRLTIVGVHNCRSTGWDESTHACLTGPTPLTTITAGSAASPRAPS
jgi:hypothetical protein